MSFFRDVAQSGSVLAWGARGRWFESSRPDFKNKVLQFCRAFLFEQNFREVAPPIRRCTSMGARGRWFEPSRPDFKRKTARISRPNRRLHVGNTTCGRILLFFLFALEEHPVYRNHSKKNFQAL